LCPSDVVTTSGESVLMQVSGKPNSSLRWYRDVNSTYSVVIYTGNRMDYKQVYILHRKSVINHLLCKFIYTVFRKMLPPVLFAL